MFVRLDKKLPADPAFPADLGALGYKVNEAGKFVSVSDEHKHHHFNFFHSDNERANEVRKEAMHIAAREVVKQELARLGVKEVYLTGDDGDIVEEEKPDGPHLSILTTDLDVLREKTNVVLIVGEHNQDPGVFAYRLLMDEGGIDEGDFETFSYITCWRRLTVINCLGSAVGMVKQLHTMGFGGVQMLTRALSQGSNDSVSDASVNSSNSTVAAEDVDEPGVVICNPGQLLYSHMENKCMTWATWNARTRPTALSKGFQVHNTNNHVRGHTTADEHIATVFDNVLPQLVNRAARVHVVAITDGAERFIKWFDRALEEDDSIAHQIDGMAFTEPTHNPAAFAEDSPVHDELKWRARSYIKSTRPLGTFINAPDAMKDIRTEEEKEEDRVEEERNQAKAKARTEAGLLALEESHAGTQPVVVAKSGTEVENTDINVPIVGDDPVDISPSLHRGSSQYSISGSDLGAMEALGRSIEEYAALHLPGFSNNNPAGNEGVVTNDSENGSESGDIVDGMAATNIDDDGYDYANNRVSCPTFSGGVEDIDELILPRAMEKVLNWLSYCAGQE